jgi:lipopolysaccharide transport system permease protein
MNLNTVNTQEHGDCDEFVVDIEPSRKWVSLNLTGLWQYRDLLYFLALRDVKVRYKQAMLGVAWAILQPLLTMVIFTLLFGRLVHVPSDGVPYALFAYTGLLPWTFFANAVTNGSTSLVSSANLITKVYFPRLIIPAAAVVAGLVDFGVSFLVLFGMIAYYKAPLRWTMLALPLLMALTALLALAIGMWTSALNVKYRDIRYALPFVVQLWMFATPIIYSINMVPERWRWVLYLNPMAGIVQCYRQLILGTSMSAMMLASAVAATFFLLVFAAYFFRSMEKDFADLV